MIRCAAELPDPEAVLAAIAALRERGVRVLDVYSPYPVREIEVALKNRERVIGVENERVEKDRALEAIARERETELQRIAKDKEVAVEKRAIAEVIRERIAVEKTVAEQEEAIKRLRVVEEAERNKEATVIAAVSASTKPLRKRSPPRSSDSALDSVGGIGLPRGGGARRPKLA